MLLEPHTELNILMLFSMSLELTRISICGWAAFNPSRQKNQPDHLDGHISDIGGSITTTYSNGNKLAVALAVDPSSREEDIIHEVAEYEPDSKSSFDMNRWFRLCELVYHFR